MSKTIMGIQLNERMNEATKFQSILSKYGCSVNTRIGLHMASADACSPSGLIILEFIDNADDEIKKFEEEVASLNVIIKKMQF